MAEEPLDTEQKIKEAARNVFLKQGFDGAKIRQIADEAGVNIALVNYYFRSKEQLFKSIYLETIHEFFGRIILLLNEEIPLEVKIWKLVDRYTDFILQNPAIPLFILSEQRQDKADLFKELNVKNVLENSYFAHQIAEEAAKGAIRPIHPLQLVLALISNIIFPTMARPLLTYVGSFDEAGFQQFMDERKRLIPEMIMAYLRKN